MPTKYPPPVSKCRGSTNLQLDNLHVEGVLGGREDGDEDEGEDEDDEEDERANEDDEDEDDEEDEDGEDEV